MAQKRLFSQYGGPKGRELECAILAGEEPLSDSFLKYDIRHVCSAVYFKAKNTVYGQQTYYGELNTRQGRIDFARAFTVTSAGLLLVMGAVSAYRRPSRESRAKNIENGTSSANPSSGGEAIAKSADPPQAIRRNSDSVEQGGARAMVDEGTVKKFYRPGWATIVFLILAVVGRFVFVSEEKEFNKRAYGYFESQQPVAGATSPLGRNVQTALPGVSGMVKLDLHGYLVVHDAKADSPHVPRIGLLRLLNSGRLRYSSIELTNLAEAVPPKDVESICAVPGRLREYVMAESGRHEDHEMRLFHFEVAYRDDGSLLARLRRTINVRGRIENCEGIACTQASDGSLILLLGDRGGSNENPDGMLYWGPLDLGVDQFTPTGSVDLRLPESARTPQARACSDLFLDEGGTLWGSGAFDPDKDSGPFWSVIYKIGRITNDPGSPVEIVPAPQVVWRVDGLKVEALAASIIANTSLCFATDDEHYGAVWRALPQATSIPVPVPNSEPDEVPE